MKKNDHGRVFLDFIYMEEHEMEAYKPIAGSFAALICENKYLLCYNKWREQWELPAGRKEKCETSKECAIRELYEETGQVVKDMNFKGLLKVKDVKSEIIKYNPVYVKRVVNLQPFRKNNETNQIKLWDQQEELPAYDPVDLQLLNFLK
ncbi:NUDIX domain-containing protein [Ornithinibacillus sp. L9]|uniref:NUDIX domain-containing protein n=1 Tax=Ornithinibacillus caprae TaxID=2678566 RepID=A0A6N8FI87_9BACI|nr:NUDIX hydrolase [Ornithinibacillus caprae]MUK89372.1 NUDIX domain-containing protein [Ornithinibacillus caprae]